MNFKKPVVLSWILLAGLVLPFPGNSRALASESWQELPPLALQDCVQVDKVLAPNPFSPAPNEFWMVLKYEEQPAHTVEGGVSPQRPAGESAEGLNMYLVTGLTLITPDEMGLPYSFLIVAEKQLGHGSETVRQWLLSDTDNDGRLDKVRFEQTVTGEGGNAVLNGEVDVPEDQLSFFQQFFERAVQELSSKAETDVTQHCSFS